MKPDYDIIMFGLIRTDFKLSSTSVAWAKEWAKTNRVFYIDRPYSIKDVRENWKLPAFKKRMNALFFGKDLYEPNQFGLPDFVQVTPRITLPLNFLPDGVVYNILNRFNNYMVTLAIRRIIRDNKVEKYIYFNSFHPVLCPFVPLSVKPQPLANIYQSLDEISEEPYIARHGVMAEKFAVKYCDIAIGTSTKLCKRLSEESQRKVHLLANAADFHTFENAMNKDLPKPDAFTQFTKPVIIYTGHYSDLRMDHDLVIKLAKVFSDHEMVFVGTFDEADREKYGLNKIQNLHFLGSRPIEQLPACLKYSKVAIIPYKRNSLTEGIYPLKINEYLAAGIPCVSTHFSTDMDAFKEMIYLADTHEQFIEGVKSALQENPYEKLAGRIQAARENSWRMRINKLEGIIDQFSSQN